MAEKHECESTESDTHSDDMYVVYTGKREPRYLCGYHATREGKLF